MEYYAIYRMMLFPVILSNPSNLRHPINLKVVQVRAILTMAY